MKTLILVVLGLSVSTISSVANAGLSRVVDHSCNLRADSANADTEVPGLSHVSAFAVFTENQSRPTGNHDFGFVDGQDTVVRSDCAHTSTEGPVSKYECPVAGYRGGKILLTLSRSTEERGFDSCTFYVVKH